jgi:sulfite exporter TauE/SafE
VLQPQEVVDDGRLRRLLLLVGAVLLFFSVVVTEPQTTTDMAVVTAGAAMVLVGLYLSRKAEETVLEKAEREEDVLDAAPDIVPEDSELPRRNPFDGEG